MQSVSNLREDFIILQLTAAKKLSSSCLVYLTILAAFEDSTMNCVGRALSSAGESSRKSASVYLLAFFIIPSFWFYVKCLVLCDLIARVNLNSMHVRLK